MKGTRALVILTALTVAAGCAEPAAPAATKAAPVATTTAPAVTKTAPAATKAGPAAWATTPVTVTHEPPVPPVPVVTGIRYAAHTPEGYDRIVLDIPGALPGYTVKYVTEVRRDGSGDPVALPGTAYLLIVLHPAEAHQQDAAVHRTGLAGIKAYAMVGDYEGYVSIALGLSGKQKFHVGELTGRIYIDVAL
jgi:hypothetical protein